MGNVQGQKKSQFHPNRKREVLATADVLLQQVQVIGGQDRLHLEMWPRHPVRREHGRDVRPRSSAQGPQVAA